LHELFGFVGLPLRLGRVVLFAPAVEVFGDEESFERGRI